MIFFCFTRITNNKVATKGCIRFTRSNITDAVEETLTIAPATHTAQQWLTHMLQGEIKIRDSSVTNGVNQGITQIAGIEIQQTCPLNHFRDFTYERNNAACPKFTRAILTVASQVLGDEDNFAGLQLLDFGKN